MHVAGGSLLGYVSPRPETPRPVRRPCRHTRGDYSSMRRSAASDIVVPSRAPRSSSTARAGLAWLVAWSAFFGALGLMSRAMPMNERSPIGVMLVNELGTAVTWAMLSLAIA